MNKELSIMINSQLKKANNGWIPKAGDFIYDLYHSYLLMRPNVKIIANIETEDMWELQFIETTYNPLTVSNKIYKCY